MLRRISARADRVHQAQIHLCAGPHRGDLAVEDGSTVGCLAQRQLHLRRHSGDCDLSPGRAPAQSGVQGALLGRHEKADGAVEGGVMPAYLVARVDVRDWTKYREYMRHTPRVIAHHGGKFIVRGGDKITLEGAEDDLRIVVI